MIGRDTSGTPLFRYRSEFFDCSLFRTPASATTVLFQISRRIFNAVERNYIKRRFRTWCKTRPTDALFRIRLRVLKSFNIRDQSFWKRALENLDRFMSGSERAAPRG